MNYKLYFWLYLITINAVSGILFAYDKFAAVKDFKRIREATLHLFEALGGVYANLLLMFILRHKSRKSNYYMWTWLILIIWVLAVVLIIQ